MLDYQYYGKWKLKGKTVTFTLEDSKSVVEGANDLLPAGSTIKFKIDKKNMRITREFEPRGVFVYERNHQLYVKNVAIEIECYVFSYNQ